MNTSNLTFTANDQELVKNSGLEEYASNSVSYIKATFTLGENWSGFDSVRAVWSSYYNIISTVLDTNNSCLVPAEMLLHKSEVKVNLVGSIVENNVLTDRLTTFPIKALKVSADAKVNGTETTPVSPSQFEQFVNSVEAAAQSVTDYSYDSEAWAKGTRGGVAVPSTDETYHNNSKYYADQGAALSQEVTNLKSDLATTTEVVAVESGTWSNNAKSSDTRTLRSTKRFAVKKGDYIALTANGLFAFFDIYSTETGTTLVQQSEGLGGTIDSLIYQIENDGYLVIRYRTATIWGNSSNITPSDYAGKTVVHHMTNNKVDKRDIDSIMNLLMQNVSVNVAMLGDFDKGGLDSGVFIKTQPYRVTMQEAKRYDRAINIAIASGYRCGYASRSDTTSSFAWSGWFQNSITIPANVYFKLEIAKVSESTSSIADVDEFVNACTITNAYLQNILSEHTDEISEINDSIQEVISPTFEQGAISGGADSGSSTYCRTPEFVFMPKGSHITFGGLSFQIVVNVYYYYAPNVGSYASYASGDTPANPNTFATVVLPEDAYVRLRVCRGNGAAITPTDVESWDAIKYYKSVTLSAKSDIKVESFNSAYLTESVDWETPLSNYSSLFNDSEHADAFLFFTDPHIMGANGTFPKLLIQKYIGYLQKIYNNCPCAFIVGGGDWLNSGDTVAQAKMKLAYINGMMHSLFGDDYKAIVGNHDTNYIGAETLDYQTMTNLWYGREGKNYYKFKTPNATYYVLDTWHENQTTMNDYRWEQIDWLANDLKENDAPRNALMFHIFYSAGVGTTTNTFADVIGQIIEAYNNHSSVSTYGRTYDFSGTTGKIYYASVGHSHGDFTDTIGGVPCIGTINMQNGNVPSFDLVYADYSNNLYKTVRVGTGSDRSISI